jgi:chemotaxis protein methyltransferase CheR
MNTTASARSPITDQEFTQFQKLIHDIAGITLTAAKKPLVSGRLAKRLAHHGVGSYGDYFRILQREGAQGELQVAVDLLTTNETYFFREPKHFEFLRDEVLAHHRAGRPFRVWSAACSSGQEPYTLAMVLADSLGDMPWEILASDISTRVLERARSGQYALEQAEKVPRHYLTRYCLKGVGTQDGTFIVDRALRSRIQFAQINLNQTLPNVGEFDVIFLRNVMIYFNAETKRQVVRRLGETLRRCGHLIIGHSESLNGVTDALAVVKPSIYRKP